MSNLLRRMMLAMLSATALWPVARETMAQSTQPATPPGSQPARRVRISPQGLAERGVAAASRPATSQPASRPRPQLLPIGSAAPKFEATALSGMPIRFPDDYAGQLVLLQVWASWCPSCARDYPFWIKAQQEFGDLGLTLLGVATDENHRTGPGEVQTAMTKRGGTWEVIYQDAENGKQLGRYLAPSLPTLYLIDGDSGRIIDAGDDLRRGRLLKTLEKHMRAKFPEQFPGTQPTTTAPVQPGPGQASQPTASGPVPAEPTSLPVPP